MFEIRDLTLALLVAGVRAGNVNAALAADQLAIRTARMYRRLDFHF